MKIAMINGSPKPSKSTSVWLLEKLTDEFTEKHEIRHFNTSKKRSLDFGVIFESDVIVLSFPLYVDALPSHVLEMMMDMEEYLKTQPKKEQIVYAMVNNGFYEGKQNRISLDIIKHWCLRTGLKYGQGLGQGAGEIMQELGAVKVGHGPLKNLGKEIRILADNIEARKSGEDMLFNPNFPRVAYHLAAIYGRWHKKAKENGLKISDIKNKKVKNIRLQ